MGELRAYAVGVDEVRRIAGATGARAERIRTLAAEAIGSHRPDVLGPIYRRVPGADLVHDDEPTKGDLHALLARTPVPADRAAATWRLVEAVVAALAQGSIVIRADQLPAALEPLDLGIPPVPGLTTGWCSINTSAGSSPLADQLAGWSSGLTARSDKADESPGPAPDLVVFWSA